ncbi:Light-harvesting complex [Amphidinium carterae]
MSSKTLAALGLAVAATPSLAFQPSNSLQNAAEVERINPEKAQDCSTLAQEVSVDASSVTSPAGVATAGALVSAAVVIGRSRRKSKVARKGLQTSPGYNTLPEMDKKNNGFEGVIGDQAPLGYWDPLGFSKDGDAEKFKRRREIEIKHGRIAMFATIGYIAPEYFKFDGYLSPSENIKFSDVPNGLAALSKVPVAGWGQILAFIGFIELVYNKGSPEPGNFGKGYFGLGSVGLNTNIANPGARANKLKVELANGRLAMMAIIGMFFQDGLTGSAWGDWSLYTASPLRAFEGELGVTRPMGYFDPLGLSSDGDKKTFIRRRKSELKNGRVAMWACMGWIVPEWYRFPGELSPSSGLKFSEIPNGMAALKALPTEAWAQMGAFVALLELGPLWQDESRAPGDFKTCAKYGFPMFFVGGREGSDSDPVKNQYSLNAEINNGRLAMMAITGMVFQNGITGTTGPEMWAVGAFESERGVQDPVGFFDPLGFTADGSVENFKRRRQTEIKHGRVAMLATMGYITPEITGKLPGYLSPSTGVKYDDIPNGLGAISKVPAAGWGQMIAYAAFCELSQDQSPGTPAAEGDFGFKVLTSSEPAELEKKLSAEIANGRLAMMAIIGMFFQDGLTGSAWGDWASYTASPLRAFEEETGVQPPLGFWDPLGYTSNANLFDFKRRREVELKHGRVAMFATMGYIAPEYFRFEGFCSPSYGVKFADVPNGFAALGTVPALGWFQIVLFAGLIEITIYNETVNDEPGNYGAGNLGLRTLGVTTQIADPESRKKKLNAELANGRLAMMAIIGMFFQEGLTGSAWGDWANYTESPLRAFETENGVQAPVGFWDPVGFTSTGDMAAFKRRREVEIKHGRVAMYAAMGYITPEYFKFDGYLSPSMGIKFSDVPNGLAAISQVPLSGWAQIIAFLGYYELFVNMPVGTEPGNFGKGNLGLGKPVANAELRKKKLNAEIANGRLAMMAIIGMFYQDGLTGSAWGDWALYTDSPLRAFEEETGVQPPLGFWDPLGYTSNANLFDFKRRREVELKHGRVAMFATMGYIAPEYFRFEGYCSPSYGVKFADVPNGFAALGTVPALGWFQIVLFAGLIEITIYNETVNDEPGNYGAGNLGLRTLGVTTQIADPESRKKKLNAELANGRLAMMAIIGMFFQEGLTGSAWGDWANYTESPLRAFENELGVQAPVGFWDPVGFTADGNVASFRLWTVELKHGRISMLAAMGYMTPEITGKFPGYLSPSMGLKFADVPNGLAAISKVPAAGWAQIAAYMGAVDVLGGFQDYKTGTPGDYGWKLLTSSDPAEKQVKLAAELANGRLAMVAILAMFFQNGTVGTTGPEMWLPSNNGWNP